jgi:tRNA U34 5-methylaminomethyl-2-thiouridine-forming methyltransferase MnmC
MNETPDIGALALEWIDGDMPYSPAFGDHFYCREDGRAECGHVFLAGNGLPERWAVGGVFVIGELGFGTGLNFCETWRVWKSVRGMSQERESQMAEPGPAAALHFISFELHPMDRASIDKALRRWPELDAERQALVAQWPAGPRNVVDLRFGEDMHLTVVCGDAAVYVAASEVRFDAWYLDGFAPSRNPAMWSEEILKAVFDHTRPGGRFATYAAAGFVRRNLVAAGFAVERRPGFAGKREMLCGQRGPGTDQ